MLFNLYRFIDRGIGTILCVVLGILGKLIPRYKRVPRHILLVRLWGMGDAVVSLPAVYALKKKYPHAKLTVLCRKRTKAPYEHQEFVDEIQEYEFENYLSLFFKFRHYDLVIDTEQYLNLSGLLSWWLGKRCIGFDHGVRSLLYTNTITFSREHHMLDNYLEMIGLAGAKYSKKTLLPLHVSKTDIKYVDDYMKRLGLSEKDFKVGICCTVAESGKTRLWNNKKWAVLCDQLVKKYGAKIVFIGGPAGRTTHNAIMRHMKEPAIDAYETSVRQSFELVRRLDAMISLDTGPMHVAAAQQVPTVGVFGPNTPVLWGPYGPQNVEVYHRLNCSPCILNEKGQFPECLRLEDKNLCMTSIEPIDILNAFEKIK